MKYRLKVFTAFFLLVFIGSAQNKYEREHQIKKSQFPPVEQRLLSANSKMKQQRFYKEVDSSQTTYTMKFKLDRLRYFMDFDQNGKLQNIGFRVKEVDIPSDAYSKIESYLTTHFDKVKIRRMHQEYMVLDEKANDKTLKDAFQNMLLPSNRYRLIIATKKNGKRMENEALFNAEGSLKMIRKTLPVNYDHVLY